jgi:glycosyltransferase involved in cell wall biosynthesis/spore maturation protein CgeB
VHLENESKLEQQQGFHANLAEQYKGEAKRRTAELLEAKDLLLRAAEERATVENRLVQIESQRAALETERRTLREALQSLREQYTQDARAAVPISQSYPETTSHTSKLAVKATQPSEGVGLSTGPDRSPLPVGMGSMTIEEKALFEEKLDHAIKTGGISALKTSLEKQVAGCSPQFVAFCWLKAASVALANGHVADAIKMADIALKNHPLAITARSAAPLSRNAPVAVLRPTRAVALPAGRLTMACIMDEFTFGAFQPEARLQPLTPAHWRAELESANPDLLFIESAWRGKDDLWGNKVGHTSTELQGIVEWCRTKHIPTVFWCKEDPIHFETFLNTAKLFDYVFTTDIDCIHRYKAALGHDRVYLLPFACQPATNHPIETYERKDAFCFAGAYYVRYPERTRDLGDFVLELPLFRPLEIYDRNYGKHDPNYQFPEDYRPYIVGTLPFDQIDKAYKGYRYAINLNSIKQSQSMFARRVFELLGSNTITISNFSRGLRLLFGDLVITTDSGADIVRRLKTVADDEARSRKLRLAGLRKVMREHTYGQRLAYVVAKVSGKAIVHAWPHMAVLAYAAHPRALESLLAQYHRQHYAQTSLYVVVGDGVVPPTSADTRVQILTSAQAQDLLVGGLASQADLVVGMVAEDYYGPHYLTDIALATRYTPADLIGKAARYTWEGGQCQLRHPDAAYRPVQRLPARAAAIRRQGIANEPVLAWVQSLGTRHLHADQGLAIDEFNYCEQGAAADAALIKETVDDLPGLHTGLSIDSLLETAERIAPESSRPDEGPKLTGAQLANDFGKKPSDAIILSVEGPRWRVSSMLPDGKHDYLYATVDHRLEEVGFTEQLKAYFDVTPGLNIQLVLLFLDAQRQKISHVLLQANRNQEASIPSGTEWVRFGLRVYAGGQADIQGLVLGHRNLQPPELLGQAEQLLLTNQYPSYSDLYRNAFVHSRVRAYHARGVRCDVFRLRPDEAVSYHEFEDVDVTTGSQEVLHRMLASGRYKRVLVHFLDEAMWAVLQQHIARIPVIVWVHGAEIQPWHRRDNFENEQQREVAKIQSEARMTFWRGLLKQMPPNMKLIFVSKYLADITMEDLGFRLPESRYMVIHNAIDTDLFVHHKKSAEQRRKILSIRPYASRTYANDLSVKAILALSKKPYFKDLEFRMIGDGKLFDEVLEPVRGFNNVYIERRYLTHLEIAAIHHEYGIFLCPSRMDTQGVSRDEAMSSGLVPVTNSVGAIPEFVDDTCGFLADPEDSAGLAESIAKLYESPELFLAMSAAAAERVRMESSCASTVELELTLFNQVERIDEHGGRGFRYQAQMVNDDAAA